MTARFVITKTALASKGDGKGIEYSVEYGDPRFVPREARKSRITIELTAEAEALPLSELIRLFESAMFRDNPKYHKPPLPRLKAPDAKAFATYRERRVVWEAKDRAPDETARLEERRRIIQTAQARRDAVAAIGAFCASLGSVSVGSLSQESTQ